MSCAGLRTQETRSPVSACCNCSRASGPLRYAVRWRIYPDPPQATCTEAGPLLLDEDYLVLSTIHSAKGQEWDAVFVLNVTEGCIPSDMAAGSPEQIEEECRLLYVAMTRARQHLHLVHPSRFFRTHQHRYGDDYVLAMRSRFIPDIILDRFERRAHSRSNQPSASKPDAQIRVDVAAKMREIWN